MPNTSLNPSALKKPKCSDGREAVTQRNKKGGSALRRQHAQRLDAGGGRRQRQGGGIQDSKDRELFTTSAA